MSLVIVESFILIDPVFFFIRVDRYLHLGIFLVKVTLLDIDINGSMQSLAKNKIPLYLRTKSMILNFIYCDSLG
jgi:hypothetical protein